MFLSSQLYNEAAARIELKFYWCKVVAVQPAAALFLNLVANLTHTAQVWSDATANYYEGSKSCWPFFFYSWLLLLCTCHNQPNSWDLTFSKKEDLKLKVTKLISHERPYRRRLEAIYLALIYNVHRFFQDI